MTKYDFRWSSQVENWRIRRRRMFRSLHRQLRYLGLYGRAHVNRIILYYEHRISSEKEFDKGNSSDTL